MSAYGASDLDARLAAIASPVRLVFFTQTFGCETCLEARQVVDGIAAGSDLVTVEEHNLVLDRDVVAAYGVDRAPALAVVGAHDLGIRYYGTPAGYEIDAVVEAIELAAAPGPPVLAEATASALAGLDRDLRLQVFVTPT